MFTDDWDKLTPDAAPGDPPRRLAERAHRVRLARGRGRPTASACSSGATPSRCKKPARVPIAPWIGLFPLRYAGFTGHDAYYDYDKLGEAWDKFHDDFRPDAHRP